MDTVCFSGVATSLVDMELVPSTARVATSLVGMESVPSTARVAMSLVGMELVPSTARELGISVVMFWEDFTSSEWSCSSAVRLAVSCVCVVVC